MRRHVCCAGEKHRGVEYRALVRQVSLSTYSTVSIPHGMQRYRYAIGTLHMRSLTKITLHALQYSCLVNIHTFSPSCALTLLSGKCNSNLDNYAHLGRGSCVRGCKFMPTDTCGACWSGPGPGIR